jgi:hypothetical protein
MLQSAPARRVPIGSNGRARTPSFGSRWLDWAQSLIARYEQVRARFGSPSMVVVRALAFSARLQERRMLPAVKLYPQVNLSIQPILHFTLRREARGGQPGVNAASSVAMRSKTFRLCGEKSSNGHETGALRGWTGMEYLKPPATGNMSATQTSFIERLRKIVDHGDSQTTFADQGSTKSFSTDGLERSKSAASSLQLVFQRLRYADDSTGINSHLQQRAGDLALRVVRQTERVERRAPAAPAAVLRRPAAAATEQQRLTTPVFTTEHRAQSVPGGFDQPMGAWAGRSFAQTPELNMDQITEQVMRRIDDRVIAMRERLGHV